MFILFGTYTFKRRISAYRPIHCHACGEDTLGMQSSCFAVLHLFWVPLIPMGIAREWCCSTCWGSPVQTEQRQARGGAIFLTLFVVMFWTGFLLTSAADHDHAMFRNLALFTTALLTFFAWYASRCKTPFADGLSPTPLDHCAICNGALVVGDKTLCSECGAERLG